MLIRITVFCFLLTLLFSKNAYAYIDPGVGSYVYQLIIAALLGGGIVTRLFWSRIKGFFMRGKKDGKN